ncbi:glutathione synthetase [Paraliobacillus ryukyuensis]|uniref:SSU ribosomal protein S6P modification protein n=1 Tax=Paraliobacillus ryukyuensis TaxID=200904 RepID=A0A366EAU5_9BACI|nr:RimK family alpha-L-glutamate ligase [Paraliobacillus ryukyuensis]RBO99486.1 SSU ribosomal protein S6P modification protein [Paraliobacillus ryukyuensis]
MYGWIIYNGHLQSDAFLTFANWVSDAGTKKGIQIDQIKNNELLVMLDDETPLLSSGQQRPKPSFVIFIDKDISLARQLESLGIPVFNTSQAIATCDNKVEMYEVLHQANIPIPKTILAPKIFSKQQNIAFESFYPIEKALNYPIIVKEGYGSYGEQVYLIHNREALIEKIQDIADRPFVFQSFIQSSYGKDVRLYVVGDEVVAGLRRENTNDFRANVAAGGKVMPFIPNEQQKQLAIAATKAVGADFAGVDLLFGESDEPIVCEVNTSAHIKNIYDYTGVNIAEHILALIIK